MEWKFFCKLLVLTQTDHIYSKSFPKLNLVLLLIVLLTHRIKENGIKYCGQPNRRITEWKFLKDAIEKTTRCKEIYDLWNKKEHYKKLLLWEVFFSLLITDPFMKATHALLKKMQLTHRISIQFQRIHKFPQTHGISD